MIVKAEDGTLVNMRLVRSIKIIDTPSSTDYSLAAVYPDAHAERLLRHNDPDYLAEIRDLLGLDWVAAQARPSEIEEVATIEGYIELAAKRRRDATGDL